MRTLLFVVAVLVLVGTANSQNPVPPIHLSGLTSGTSWTVAYAYVNSQSDTSKAIAMGGRYTNATVIFKANDSVSVTLNYRPSYDGITFGAKVAIGSAHTATGAITSSAPDIFAWEIPAIARMYPAIQLVVDHGGSGAGVTSPASCMSLVVTP